MINFQYVKATSKKAAVDAVVKDPTALFIAGGTNLVDLMKKGVMTPEKLVDINSLPLKKIEKEGKVLQIFLAKNDSKMSIFDQKINPYVQGIWGNWRGWRSYVYYANRKQTNPDSATNIRTDGVIDKFKPFWIMNSVGINATSDTSRWVWNSEITRYNRRGLETENHDPLGRFNSGLYGYNNTLSVAVT